MEATQPINETAPQQNSIERMFMENTLLRVAGVLFCHDQKRAASRTAEMVIDRGLKGRRIVVKPNASYGQPGPLAHKIFVAIVKKHSDYGRPVQSDVSFTKRELMRLIWRKEGGGGA